MKKIFIPAMITALTISILSGCTSPTSTQNNTFKKTTEDKYPLTTDKELTYWVTLSGHVSAHSKSLNETEFAKGLAEKTGIKVNFIHPAVGQEVEQFNLMIASGDLPDIIESGWLTYAGGPDKAIAEGTIKSLNDIIDTVSPNIKKYYAEHPDYRKQALSQKGDLYVYPFVRGDESLMTYIGPMVRKDLLNKIGKPIPETVDEWESVLKAFKDMGVKMPLTMKMDNPNLANVSPFLGAFGLAGTFFVENDKVKFGPYEPKFKDFVALMTKWYSEGLLDSNFMDTDSKRVTAIMANGDGGAAFGSAGGDFGKWIPALQAKVPDGEFVPAKYPVMKKGDRPMYGQKDLALGGYGAAISGKSKNVELAARLLDYGYSEEGHMYYNFGIEGKSYTMKDAIPTYTDIVTDKDKNGGLAVGAAMGKYTRASYNGPFVQDKYYLPQFYTLPVQNDAITLWKDTDTLKYKMPVITLTPEENKEYTKIMQDIDVYRQEVLFKTISGRLSLSDFDSYFKELKDRKMDRAIEIQQAAYDRYKTR